MAAQQPSGAAIGDDGYRSEDEDSTVEPDFQQFPDVEDPVITIQENSVLNQENWELRDPQAQLDWQYYVPSWTRPGYDDNVEVRGNGQAQRPRRGGFWHMMRPALLPTDPPATQYAKRFGIFPVRVLNENSEARSMLTPMATSTAAPGLNDSGIPWSFEQSFQSTVFQSFTTQELSDLGALDPSQILPRPDLNGDLFHLFTRDKWIQPHGEERNLATDFSYNLGGQNKRWAVEENDELWNVLQPSLQFASKVLLSEHPFWKAMLSVYHLRPVPDEKDGRTQEQKADPSYKPYVSVWYDIDRNKMYPRAKVLMDKNFDSFAATLAVLGILLRFSIMHTDKSSSATTRLIFSNDEPEDWRIRIDINAAYIWPLLAPQYSVSEKTAISFFLGKVIVHELAHAARCAQQFLLKRPQLLTDMLTDEPWTPPPGTAFDWGMMTDLIDLGQEAFAEPPMEYVFQDVPQVEEGKCFEQQLFGFELSSGPEQAAGRQNEVHRPLIAAVSWPWKHPMIHLQNQRSVDDGQYAAYTTHGYKTYLLDPPASAYDLYTPLPVSSFAKFMQQSWWDSDFVRFGHQGLKIPIHSTDPSSQIKTAVRPNESIVQFLPMLTMVIRSQAALDFITSYGIPVLFEHGHNAILTYLILLTREAAAASLMRNRLHYEKRTWPNTLRAIQELSHTSAESFETVWYSLNQTLQGGLSETTLFNIVQVGGNIRALLINLSELNRLLGVEIQYSQGIAAQYILKTPEERRKIHRRYMRVLRENLGEMNDAITATLDRIGCDHEGNGQLQWKTVFAPWEARLTYLTTVQGDPSVLDEAVQQQIQVTITALADLRNDVQQKSIDLAVSTGHVDSILRVLGDDYIDLPMAAAPSGLFPGVPIARSMMQLSKSVELSAVREIIRLADPNIDEIVRQWVVLLQAHVGLSDRMGGVRQEIYGARIRADLMAIKTVLFQAKRGPDQPAAQGGQLSKQERIAGMRAQIRSMVGNDEGLRTFLRDACRAENDEGESNAIMRIPYQAPAPQ